MFDIMETAIRTEIKWKNVGTTAHFVTEMILAGVRGLFTNKKGSNWLITMIQVVKLE